MLKDLFGMNIKAVIFDFDGVIVDTEPLHHAAFSKTLNPLGIDISWQEYIETYIGFDDRDALRHAYGAAGRALSVDGLAELIAQKAAFFQEVILNGVAPYPGVVELVTILRKIGAPLAICSGALRVDIDPIIRSLGIDSCFDIIVTADDVAKSKPDPESYTLAYSRLQSVRGGFFSRETTLAIEDTPAGISSAKGAGLKVCAVTNSYPAAKLYQADLVTESLLTFANLES